MTSQMNDIQTQILSELAAIRAMLNQEPSAPSMKEKKTKKVKDPNAAPKAANPWILFTGRVRDVLKANEFAAGKESQQFASHLKSINTDAYSMTDEEILTARKTWTCPEKPKEKEKEKEKEKQPKEKAAKKEAAEKKAFIEALFNDDVGGGTVQDIEEAASQMKKVAPTTTPAPSLRPFPLKGKKYLWDPESNGLWLPGPNNTKGAWAGVLSADRKSIDTSAAPL
jgi:hypothetical protein